MCHAALDQLCSLVGEFSGDDGVQREMIQELIGQLYWAVENGRLKILLEMLLLLSYLAMPRSGTSSKHSISLNI